MNIFSTSTAQLENQFANAQMNQPQPRDFGASWYEGLGTGLMSGLKTAVARELFVSTADEDQKRQSAQRIKELKPDTRSVGLGGQLLYSLADNLTVAGAEFAGGAVLPNILAASVTDIYGKTQTAANMLEGMDPATAARVANYEAIGAGLGIVAPAAVPGGLAMRAASGAGINTALGFGQRVGISETLKGAGYADMAKQYAPFDAASVLTDAALGAFFGGALGPRASKPAARPSPSNLDAGLTMNNAAHIETGVAPGIPVDAATRGAHVQSVENALESLVRGEPVNVAEGVVNGQFIENPSAVKARNEIVLAVDEHMGPEWATLKAELDKRGIVSEDLDTSTQVRMVEATPSEPMPGAIIGQEAAVKIEGAYYPVRWALVDAGQVEATMGKAENQFRDRNRAASQAQIAKIAADPDYNLLTDSPIMDFGAPTLTRDGKIVGGNGRFAGVSKAYELGTAGRYTKPLLENLRRYGIDPDAAKGMQRPVLVRVLQADVDVRRAAMASNEGAGLRMSALEQAKVDSERLGDIAGLQVSEMGQISTAANIGYIRQWAGQMPDTERGTLVDKNGMLSQEGEKRLRNAILFRAFGDSATLERLVESTDPGARNVATALLRTAPTIAEVKSGIEAGSLHQLDISTDIASAVEVLDRVRRDGMKVGDYLAQNEMFGAEISPEARVVLQFLGENIRSAKAMSEFIANYYEGVKAAGDPNQGDIFGAAAPNKKQLLDAAAQKTGRELDTRSAELPFAKEDVSHLLPDAELKRLPKEKRGQLEDLYRAAVANKETFDTINAQIAKDVGGVYKDAPIKGAKRAIEKILSDYKGDPTRIKDLVRATIEVDNPVQAMAAIAEIRGKYEVMRDGFRNLFTAEANPADGYRDAKVNVVINGQVAEIQVHIPEMLAAKAEVHALYEQRSALERKIADSGKKATPAQIKKIAALNAEMKGRYEAAWASATSRLKSPSEMGAPLRRADSGSNLRGGEVSQAAQYGTSPGTLPSETGMPSTSKNVTDFGNFKGTSEQSILLSEAGVKTATTETIAPVLQEKPDMTIAGPAGEEVPATQALAQADAEIAKAQTDSHGYDAAANCALRG